jgi:hypothetical protein
MGWATFWAIFSQTHLVALNSAEANRPIDSKNGRNRMQPMLKMCKVTENFLAENNFMGFRNLWRLTDLEPTLRS